MPESYEASGRRAAIVTSAAGVGALDGARQVGPLRLALPLTRIRMRRLLMILALITSAVAPTLSVADVVSSAPGGFVLRFEATVAAPPADVYSKFFEIGRWWSGVHTYTGNAANLSLKNEPGSCFCEVLAGGGFVRHASLEYSDPGRIARLSGALGPLQAMGAHGLLAFNFSPADKANPSAGTKLVVSYVVSGYQPDKGFAPLAEPVNQVIGEQVTRLKQFAETGKP